jgi:hypothetical protein
MERKPHHKNRPALLMLFGIGILNFITQDNLNAFVWLSIATGAICSDILERQRLHGARRTVLAALEVTATALAFALTMVLIYHRHPFG